MPGGQFYSAKPTWITSSFLLPFYNLF